MRQLHRDNDDAEDLFLAKRVLFLAAPRQSFGNFISDAAHE
jgi:hypothetical protein